MKYVFLILNVIFLSSTVFAQNKQVENERDSAFYVATKKWFTAWELVSKELYHIYKIQPVDFVFFDDTYVYSTSTTTIKTGTTVNGCNLMNVSLKWKKKLHHDSILLPDKSMVPIRLMSFAAEVPAKVNTSFFVMPLPSYWKKNGTISKEFGLNNLVTGVFIHEFSHTQQMQNFGKSMTQFEKENNFDVEFSDDIVQELFSKDSGYTTVYKTEVKNIYQSLQNQRIDHILIKDILRSMTERQNNYFKGKLFNLQQIDNFFLTMEGLGQYSMYLWLINPKGGNIEKETAIKGVRRGGKWWSQEEGFGLFLILDKLCKPNKWARNMFGNKTENIVDFIERFLK